MKKRMLAIYLLFAMFITLLPTTALAAETVESGQCGDNLTWTLTSDGVLTISGTGDMWDYQYYWPDYANPTPWLKKYTNIMVAEPPVRLRKLVIEEGVTHIGECAFMHCSDFTGSLTIPATVTSIGNCAFVGCRGFTGPLHIPGSVTEIGNSVFNGCDGLSEIYFDGDAPAVGDTVFSENAEIYVPEGGAGWSAPDWNGYKTTWYAPESNQPEDLPKTTNVTYGSLWMSAYEDFVLGGGYLQCGQSFGSAMEPVVMLHDMDADGVPELLMTNGEAGRVTRCAYIFTCENDTVQYLGIGPTDAFYIEDSDYTGIWASYNMSPDLNWGYYRKESNEVKYESIYIESSSVSGAGIQQVTGNEALFAESQREKTQIFGKVVSDIRSIGWHSFLLESGIYPYNIPFGGETEITLNWGWKLFNKNASEYDHNLAMASLILSRAAYGGGEDAKDKLKMLGFDIISQKYYDEDVIHQPARTVAAQQIYLNGEEKWVITVVVRGTATDIDKLTDASSCVTGFQDSATNVMEDMLSCMSDIGEKYHCTLTKENTIFFLSGHSLGGAVAGILANKALQYAEPENIFTYTFGSPNYDTERNEPTDSKYNGVHNILNTDDPVQNFPWLKKRYGHDWYYDLKNRQGTINSVYGKTGEKSAHDTETYLACLLSGVPENVGDGAVNPYSLSSIHCPVDIVVLDENGMELGRTSGINVTLSDSSTVLIYTDGDAKYVLAPADVKYTIQFTATGEGVMAYSQQVVDAFSRSTLSSKDFTNVELTEGKSMRTEVGGDTDLENIHLFVLDESGKAVAEVAPDGTESRIGSGIPMIGIALVAVILAGCAVAVILVISGRKKRCASESSGKSENHKGI